MLCFYQYHDLKWWLAREAERCTKQISPISLDHHLWVCNQSKEAMCILKTGFVNLQSVACSLLLLFFFFFCFSWLLFVHKRYAGCGWGRFYVIRTQVWWVQHYVHSLTLWQLMQTPTETWLPALSAFSSKLLSIGFQSFLTTIGLLLLSSRYSIASSARAGNSHLSSTQVDK